MSIRIDTKQGGYWLIDTAFTHPGLDIEFVPNDDSLEDTRPRVVIEFPPEEEYPDKKMRALIWTEADSEEYDEEVVFNNCRQYFEKSDYITHNRADILNAALHWKEGEPGRMDENETWSRTIEFEDGAQMRIEVFGVPYKEGADNAAKARAVLIKNGKEVARTKEISEVVGLWTMKAGDARYAALLKSFYLDG